MKNLTHEKLLKQSTTRLSHKLLTRLRALNRYVCDTTVIPHKQYKAIDCRIRHMIDICDAIWVKSVTPSNKDKKICD